MCYRELGIEPGTVMRLWDAVKLIEEKFSSAFIKTLTFMPDEAYNNFIAFLAPGAKALKG